MQPAWRKQLHVSVGLSELALNQCFIRGLIDSFRDKSCSENNDIRHNSEQLCVTFNRSATWADGHDSKEGAQTIFLEFNQAGSFIQM